MFSLLIFSSNTKADGTSGLTSIMGQAQLSKDQAFEYFRSRNTSKDDKYIREFISIVWEEGQAEGVRPDVAFIQMMKETNFLKFTGDVKEEQNNFGGIGATGGGVQGSYFPNVRIGIRVVIQHLKAYASNKSLVNACVDPRFQYVSRGISPYVEWLGIGENPNYPDRGWAADNNYGKNIMEMLNSVKPHNTGHYVANIETFDIMLGKNYISGTNKLDKGKTYTIKGYANSQNGVLYEFWVKDLSTGNSTKIRNYGEDRYANWTPNKDGRYEITVNAKDKYSSQSVDSKCSKTFEISQRAGKASIETFDIMLGKNYISGTNKLDKGKTYTIKGYASSPNGVLYEFWVKDLSTGNSTKIRNYGEDRYANWTPNKDGKYEVTVNVKDKYSSQSVDSKCSKTFEISQRAGKASIETFDIMLGKNYVSGTNKLDKGKTYTIKGYASSPNGVLYEFWVKDLSTGKSVKVRNYEENRYANWTPNKDGKYEVTVNVKDKYSSQSVDSKCSKTFEISQRAGKASIETFDIMLGKNYVSGTNKLDKGKTYTIKGYASSPNGVLYEFWVKDLSTGKSVKVRNYEENRYANWTPNKDGKYEVTVNVKDKYSSQSIDGKCTKTFEIGIKQGKASIETFDIMLGKDYISGTNKLDKGKTYTIKGYASSPNGVLYEFWIKDLSTGNITKIRDYKEDRYANWTINKDGRYEVIVNVKDKYSAKELEGNISKTFNVGNVSFGLTGKTIVLDAGHGGKDSGAVSSANTGNIKEADLTQKITLKLGTLLKNAGANVIYTRDRVDNWHYPTVAKNLDDRVKVANNSNADLFISIHIDAADSSSAHGCGTHYSTYRPGLDNSGVYESGGIYYDRTPCDVALKSKILAQLIVDEISSLGLSNRGISDHNLYVTKNTNMPSVLVECGFISNDAEARRLSSDSMQSQVANKIYKGVVKLFGI
ncbi:N-acetylmuramoyl-L-alanine amidase [Clostridium niameyense]|uniref:N-acetylmuramoyl-L-alanine amidase n=1 Tax=Clostridium niameyense TaxID=1622073 RepID=UPI001FAAFEEB|nr:N-acetylmuramoyl-L-alanine amidase [Clostridium niameyense]